MKIGQQVFFLFGSEATRFYENLDGSIPLIDVASHIKDECDNFATFFYEHGTTSPSELLIEYDGWEGFCEINEELYKLLQP
jgi:hypothetical protein